MKAKDIVITGFDYATTESIIDKYTQDITEFTSIYVAVGAHREDKLLCHLRIGADIGCPYISPGKADVLCARTREDARRNLAWVSENGAVYIKEDGPEHNGTTIVPTKA